MTCLAGVQELAAVFPGIPVAVHPSVFMMGIQELILKPGCPLELPQEGCRRIVLLQEQNG
jgi:hypothetical protein